MGKFDFTEIRFFPAAKSGLPSRFDFSCARSTVNGVSLGEKLSKLTMQDLDEIGANGNSNENAYALLTAIKTSCKAMGHTDDALLLCLTIMD